MQLIPGLPDDVARDCLVRVIYNHFSTLTTVCKAWRTELQLQEFFRHRKRSCNTQKLLVMAQAPLHQTEGSSDPIKYRANPVYRLTVLDPDTGDWTNLPTIPRFPNGLPLFSQVVSAGSDFVILGGLDPASWEVSGSVHIFNFVSAKWRRGADMPGVRRLFFACASDSNQMVFVAGGHDGDKNALRSALAYDVANDEWTPLPDMASERDECKAVFHGGKLHVIGGYCTDMQGRFEKTAEVFDVANWKWDDGQNDLLIADACPRTCVSGNDKLYMCNGGEILTLKGATWQAIAKLPNDVCDVAYVVTWQDNLLVMGREAFGSTHAAYVLDLKNCRWQAVATPKQYSGHVQTGCFLEI